jgi:hypothetical protein
MFGVECGADLEEFRLVVFETMCFINNETLPVDLLEDSLLDDCGVVAGNNGIEL